MEKTKKEQAIKKLQAELKDEKLSEIQRCVPSLILPGSMLIVVRSRQAEGDHNGAQEGCGRTAETRGGEGKGAH